MRDIFYLDNNVCSWLRTLLKKWKWTKGSQKACYNTYPPNTQKYSIVTESMDILTVRLLSQFVRPAGLC